jgi:hypothetical protein
MLEIWDQIIMIFCVKCYTTYIYWTDFLLCIGTFIHPYLFYLLSLSIAWLLGDCKEFMLQHKSELFPWLLHYLPSV